MRDRRATVEVIPGQSDAESVVGPISLVEFGDLREEHLVKNNVPGGPRLDDELLKRSEPGRQPAAALRVRCKGVVDFHATGFPIEMQISGLAIDPVQDSQMEGIRFQVWDYEQGNTKFFARDVEITSAELL